MRKYYSSIRFIVAISMLGSVSCEEATSDSCGPATDANICDCGATATAGDDANAQVKVVIESYFQYVNEEKLDELLALFHPEVELWGPFGFTDRHGIEEVTKFYDFVFNSPIIHRDTPIEFFLQETQAAVVIEGTAGSSEDTLVTIYAMDWFVFEGDKIKFLSINFDSSVFMP